MSNDSLIGLAILKINWDRYQRDYLESFVPLVAESVRLLPDNVVSLSALQGEVQARFGLDIPQHALKTILKRLDKLGYVAIRDRTYVRDVAQCASLNFSALRDEVAGKFTATISALCEFAHVKYKAAWTPEHAERAFESFLKIHDERLVGAAEGSTTARRPKSGVATDHFIVSAFVEYLQSTRSPLFEHVITLAKGNVLAAGLYVPNPDALSGNFKQTQFYFDTPFLLGLMGYAGEERQQPCAEVITLLQGTGAQLAAFRGTVSELQGILDAARYAIQERKPPLLHSEVYDHFTNRGMTASDVMLLSGRLPEKLQVNGFTLENLPPRERATQIDESRLESVLQEKIGYKNRNALVHDVDCISAIARLRDGRECFSIESCKAVFVTTNSRLARYSQEGLRPSSGQQPVPPCITDFMLGNLLWLRAPTQAPDLPVKRLIADVYATLQPSEELWKLFIAEIAKLKASGEVEPSDYTILRHDLTARRALMDLTQGDEDAFSEGTVAEVLNAAKEYVRAGLKDELQTVRLAKEQELAEVRIESQRHAEVVGRERDAVAAQLALREDELERVRIQRASDDLATKTRLRGLADKAWTFAGLVVAVPAVLVAAGLGVGALYLWPGHPAEPNYPWWPRVRDALCGLFALLGLFSLLTGWNLLRDSRGRRHGVAVWLLKKWWHLLPDDAPAALQLRSEPKQLP